MAEGFATGMTYEMFKGDMRTFYAVTRCLEIISEASRRLPPEFKARHDQLPWVQIAAAGNVYRHEYEDVAAHEVWDTLTLHLPPLLAVVEAELAALDAT